MKKTVVAITSVLLAFLVLAAVPARGEEQIYQGVVRLHILAASDSAEDQGEKIAVRDALLQEWGARLAALGDASEAKAFLAENLSAMEETAKGALTGSNSLQLSFGEEYFDRRTYGEVTLPAGVYPSIVVTISEGKGQNWWCVLYPPLCTEAALGEYRDASVFAEEGERAVVTGEYTVKVRLLEWLDALFAS